MKNVLVISDQPLAVFALRAMLARPALVAQVHDANHLSEAMQMLSGRQPYDMIVLDLDTGGVRPVSTSALLRQMWPEIPLVLLWSEESQADWVQSADLHIAACLSKRIDTETLRSSLRSMLSRVRPSQHNRSATPPAPAHAG
ncbi:MAG TPA: response regulator [Burkholderiaceae bacterium]|nr:response regulator [Burkholderiaceae bacterium]